MDSWRERGNAHEEEGRGGISGYPVIEAPPVFVYLPELSRVVDAVAWMRSVGAIRGHLKWSEHFRRRSSLVDPADDNGDRHPTVRIECERLRMVAVPMSTATPELLAALRASPDIHGAKLSPDSDGVSEIVLEIGDDFLGLVKRIAQLRPDMEGRSHKFVGNLILPPRYQRTLPRHAYELFARRGLVPSPKYVDELLEGFDGFAEDVDRFVKYIENEMSTVSPGKVRPRMVGERSQDFELRREKYDSGGGYLAVG